MTTIEFGKDRYHLISEMTKWLRDNIGPGGYSPAPDAKWHIESGFGNTWYTFENDSDASLFALRWL
jgi:hypothetical protein